MGNMRDAIFNGIEKSNQVPAGSLNWDPNQNNFADNAVLSLTVTDGELFYDERIQF
jgi:hypothetical protein